MRSLRSFNRKTHGVTVKVLALAIVALLALVVFNLAEKRTVKAQSQENIIRNYAEKRLSFDIQNGLIRFSHGNHRRRNRWFEAYFGTGYGDCSNCHQIDFPEPREGERVDFVAQIREHREEDIPYGVQEEACLICHNNITAPNECQWCHVPGSQPLAGATVPEFGEHAEPVDQIIPDYSEDFQRDVDLIRDYKEKRWFFDIENNNIRFSHGNHESRDRWFNAYFGTTFRDCGNCHNLGLPSVTEQGVQLEDGEHLSTVEDIRDYEDDIYPFGIMMARCFQACHNGLTAPNDCMNCHLPGSKALTEGEASLPDEVQMMVVSSRQPGVAGGAQDLGEEIYRQRNCNLCHTLNEAGTPLAADLSDIASRRDPQWLEQFLENHQEAEPKATMPKLNFSSEDAQSLARYLSTLKEVR